MSANDELRTLLEQRRQQRQADTQYRDENGRFAKKTVSDYVQKYELPTNDLRVAELMSRDEVEEPEKEVLRLAAHMHYKQITDADKPSEMATRKTFATQQERLMQEYQEGAKNLTRDALIRWKMTMRAKGLEIS